MDIDLFKRQLFCIHDQDEFNRLAVALYYYQREHVKVYGNFLKLLGQFDRQVSHYTEIPSLPVTLFKSHTITDQQLPPAFYFCSSGTTAPERSTHYIHDLSLYEQSFMNGFSHFYGNPESLTILALLPSYLEQKESSLVFMMEKLIRLTGNADSGFFLRDHENMRDQMEKLQSNQVPFLLLGVTYALLDFFEKYPMQLTNAIIMETGGMKGRRREMVRDEVHQILMKNSGVQSIHSEYGMTELLSQAYSKSKGLFQTPPWMKVMIRDTHDPFSSEEPGQTGAIHVIDLANIHSCAFLATQDLGRRVDDSHFEVLGRMDASEWRGCNLMVE